MMIVILVLICAVLVTYYAYTYTCTCMYTSQVEHFNNGMHVYLVSLEKDHQRRQHLYKFIKPDTVVGIYGTSEIKLDLVKKGLIDKNTKLTLGEIGCYLSHLNILDKISNDLSESISLVLEDDAEFKTHELEDKLKNVIKSAPDDWEIIFLGHNGYESTDKSSNTIKKISLVYGTHGYIVKNSKNLKSKLANMYPISLPYDLAVPKHFNTYVATSKLIHLSKFGSVSNTQAIL